MLQATCGLWHKAALSVFHMSFVFVSFCLLVLQSDFRTLSELKAEDFLKSDAVQGGKYTMTVRRVSFHKPIILPFSNIQQKQTFKTYITWFYLGVLQASWTPHDMTACLFPSPILCIFSGNHLTDPADHPHSSLYLRWRRGALDTVPEHSRATWVWHSWQMCLLWQCFLPTLTTNQGYTHKGHRLFLPQTSFSFSAVFLLSPPSFFLSVRLNCC